MSIIYTSRTCNSELFQKSQSRIPHPIIPVRNTSAEGYLSYVLFALHTSADWLVNIDEDAFTIDHNRITKLIRYMEANNYDAAGLPDGGYLPIRFHNPLVLNPFFNVFNLRKIRNINNPNFNPMSDDLICKAPVNLTTPYAYDNFEPFYPTFFALHRGGANFLYLSGKTHDDGTSTVLYDHLGQPMLTHTWYARLYHEPENKKRIDARFMESCGLGNI